MAVLLGLLLLGVTAGSAIAMPVRMEPIRPQSGIGLGSYVSISIKGSNADHYSLPISGGLRKLDVWRISRNRWYTVEVKYYRIPLSGQYQFAVILPESAVVNLNDATDLDGKKILSNEYKKVEYLGPWIGDKKNTFHFKKEGWLTWKVGVRIPAKFTKRGWTIVGTLGTSMSSFGDTTKLAASFYGIKKLVESLGTKFTLSALKNLALKSNLAGLVASIIETGVNADIAFVYVG
ncbi:hypothetical protein FH039_00745 [Thermococcus indicus]|uniref:Uncharacterized protein n=1 Tax=Thermococcus indicus TaxID=2586643 RepID=A0A4Y5SK45_9EURY|nr:hypothetical protein [Thermococcus indicus]QDA30431.1 hypothetical protein FH039_00745 [Thermococcus indicus]